VIIDKYETIENTGEDINRKKTLDLLLAGEDEVRLSAGGAFSLKQHLKGDGINRALM